MPVGAHAILPAIHHAKIVATTPAPPTVAASPATESPDPGTYVAVSDVDTLLGPTCSVGPLIVSDTPLSPMPSDSEFTLIVMLVSPPLETSTLTSEAFPVRYDSASSARLTFALALVAAPPAPRDVEMIEVACTFTAPTGVSMTIVGLDFETETFVSLASVATCLSVSSALTTILKPNGSAPLSGSSFVNT